jgi:hypothetical protein
MSSRRKPGSISPQTPGLIARSLQERGSEVTIED